MKPESRYIHGVHRVLHPDVYREKMFNPLRGGTPDVYYMGFADDLWVEYKWARVLSTKIIKPDLTALQKAWLVRAHDRGRNPWVVIGSPTGSIVLTTPAEWHNGIRRDDAHVLDQVIVAMEIQHRCGLQHLEKQPSGLETFTPSYSSPRSPTR